MGEGSWLGVSVEATQGSRGVKVIEETRSVGTVKTDPEYRLLRRRPIPRRASVFSAL